MITEAERTDTEYLEQCLELLGVTREQLDHVRTCSHSWIEFGYEYVGFEDFCEEGRARAARERHERHPDKYGPDGKALHPDPLLTRVGDAYVTYVGILSKDAAKFADLGRTMRGRTMRFERGPDLAVASLADHLTRDHGLDDLPASLDELKAIHRDGHRTTLDHPNSGAVRQPEPPVGPS